ncbi:response regulator [Thalassorhabdomicrobium marinisediminis]|uniref:Response regulator n=1 Tax=Thalassorhabdomicrobium marinisediminis TaxID=2170577 RepID=A0A2T7FUP1_9RHOB|nr:response regulator [Thalassorhabdomicrobium marinisediminis]PVA05875.1 response regulator [Thalassorhabdomicrobium marinisediminis]
MFDDKKILYLEDEPLVALDTSEHLESLGFGQVEVAYRLASAEKKAAEGDFDLAMLDINVDGGQTSIALGQKLKESGVQVVFASGNSFEADRLCNEGFAFLDKPFSLGQLSETLKTLASQS